jgi:Flp pilus assembly protein TadG
MKRNMFRNQLWKLRRNQHGSITILFALSFPVMLLAIGVAVDFGRAAAIRTQLNTAADAAALAALTPAMLQQLPSVGAQAAANMFAAQVAGISGVVPGSVSLTPNPPVITNPGGNAVVRKITVTYTAQTQNFFGAIEPTSTFQIGGTSVAQASIPPNINFYLLLDNSPSMSLPATSAGIASMQLLTSQQESGGCAFACHQANTNDGDTVGNPCYNAKTNTYSTPTLASPGSTQPGNSYCNTNTSAKLTQIDNYALANQNNITLRLASLTTAVTALMGDASQYATSGQFATPPQYQFAAYSTNTLWNLTSNVNQLLPLTTNYLTDWTTAAQNFGPMEMYDNNDSCANAACSSINSSGPGDADTDYDTAMSSINSIMPKPGNGTNVPGDTPQEVLFFVTDGVEDENNPSRLIQEINAGTSTNYCSEIKARGIQIAILYTEYLPVTVNSYYDQYVEPIQPNLGPALQACASPKLYYDATLDADLSQALKALFQIISNEGSALTQ